MQRFCNRRCTPLQSQQVHRDDTTQSSQAAPFGLSTDSHRGHQGIHREIPRECSVEGRSFRPKRIKRSRLCRFDNGRDPLMPSG